MSDQLTLSAETRNGAGKGASRELRRQNRVPAVIYGNKQEPELIHVEEKALIKLLMTGHFSNSVVEIELGGKKQITIPKDVAFHPVSDRPMHVDFLRIVKGAKVDVEVPVMFVNEGASPGLKRGGVLNIVRHELELICENDKIPDDIQIDVSGFDIGDSIHISNVKLPKGSESKITDRDFTIATIVAPSALKSTEGDTTVEGEA
ncbi:MAG: 50S ribosomal protein L25/general stress protein Ctc [Sphingorhabdus sp.]|jgi:large subunit ribosomal protein L25|uniref:50S ribosomal protein L25/general stress protein Ctc n=1 Tax=Sphingorhabdus sp. TaxID=1902408 RepID=UPI0025EC713A|nr:50S ribosomal protein L25/general stress protein Ctc [Sphingorhabdus sp.]MCO4092470.1 50S ribosomal protein L25/general stress protein Ctc [Sphingorhabdus sp.]